MENVGSRIKLVRSEAGDSLRIFGNKIGISDSAVARLESGKNNPSEQTVRAICKEFNVSREWLETGKGPMHESIKENEFCADNKLIHLDKENKVKLFRIISDMPDDLIDAMIKYFDSKK